MGIPVFGFLINIQNYMFYCKVLNKKYTSHYLPASTKALFIQYATSGTHRGGSRTCSYPLSALLLHVADLLPYQYLLSSELSPARYMTDLSDLMPFRTTSRSSIAWPWYYITQ
jgi:hypothetical protein